MCLNLNKRAFDLLGSCIGDLDESHLQLGAVDNVLSDGVHFDDMKVVQDISRALRKSIRLNLFRLENG